jgi:hypothetical protein
VRNSKKQEIYTANEQFNNWLNRSSVDLHMMVTDTPADLVVEKEGDGVDVRVLHKTGLFDVISVK